MVSGQYPPGGQYGPPEGQYGPPGSQYGPPGAQYPYGPAGYYPPPGPGGYYGMPSRQETSGYAIASLVLGIVWLGGLGSILAVIFGAIARKSIRRSGGWVGGDG